ncbi:MAG: hypothetical protein ACRDZY_20120 [Acidimicrobiales bacterium]
MDDTERFRYWLNQMSDGCAPLAGKAAYLLNVARDDDVLFDLSMRAFFAGWHAAGYEVDAQAAEQGLEWKFVMDVLELPDGPLADA